MVLELRQDERPGRTTLTQRLQNQRILFIGGTRGIGKAAAQAASRSGAEILLAGRSEERLAATASELGGTVATFAVDVTQETQVAQLFEESGPIDHLVCTAASALFSPLAQQDTTDFRRLIDSKLIGQTLAVKYGAPKIRDEGSVVLCSGIVSRKPQAGASAYAAVGAATEAAARVWALEYAPLRVNVVIPGIIDTPVWDELMPRDAKLAHMRSVAEKLPVGRVGSAQDVAEAIEFLLQAKFLTGTCIEVDGGDHLV